MQRILAIIWIVLCVAEVAHCRIAYATDSASAELARAHVLFKQRNFSMAITSLNKAIDQDAHLKAAFLLRGDCHQQLKKFSDAAEDYTEYSQLAPGDPAIYVKLSKTYSSLGKNNLAVSYLSKAIVLRSRDASLYSARAAIYDSLHKPDMAANDRSVASALQHAHASVR